MLRCGGVVVVLGFVLSGCAVGSIEPIPTTAVGCKQQYDEARARASGPSFSTSTADVIGTAIGRGIAKGIVESRYQRCLATVASTGGQPLPDIGGVPQRIETNANGGRVVQTYTYGTPPAAGQASRSGAYASQPRQCSVEMFGGTGYRCVDQR
jgi:hypothetical protein